MHEGTDSIAAIATGSGCSAIGILRLSGPACIQIAQQVFSCRSGQPLSHVPSRKMVLGTLRDSRGRAIDHCMAVCARAPHSYTGEDTVELHCHGSPSVLAAGLAALYRAGARPAERGEFTKRAFLNGRMDLTQAEAVIDLIEAETADAAANAAAQVEGALTRRLAPIYDRLTDLCSHFHAVLDYPDDDIADFRLEDYRNRLAEDRQTLSALLATCRRGQVLRRGVRAAILGKPNVGKSSLLNALAGFPRAIVTDIPGTTRDTVEEPLLLGNTLVRLIDTAGIRTAADPIEAMGVERAEAAAREADAAIFVCDGSQLLTEEDRDAMRACLAAPVAIGLINKCDLPLVVSPEELPFDHTLVISAASGTGLERLGNWLDTQFGGAAPDGGILTNARQQDAVRRAGLAMDRALVGLDCGVTPDAVLLDVEEAMSAIGELTGKSIREDITARIFERFCVGK